MATMRAWGMNMQKFLDPQPKFWHRFQKEQKCFSVPSKQILISLNNLSEKKT